MKMLSIIAMIVFAIWALVMSAVSYGLYLRQVPESRWMVKTGDGGQRKILPEDWR